MSNDIGAIPKDQESPRTGRAPRRALLRRMDWLALAGATFFVAVLPFLLGGYERSVAVFIGIGIVLALSWNIAIQTGQISLGHAAFVGVGAYVTGLTVPNSDVGPTAIATIGAGLICGVLGGAIALLVMRMEPWVLAIVTLAVAETLRIVANEFESLTNGPLGIFASNRLGRDSLVALWFIGGIVLLTLLISMILRRSKLYYYFKAVRLDRDAAAMCGVSVLRTRVVAFSISGFCAGMSGAFLGMYLGFIFPSGVFDLQWSVNAQVYPIFGGLYSTAGAVLGGTFGSYLQESSRAAFADAALLVLGGTMTLIILFFPSGLMGVLRLCWTKLQRVMGKTSRTGREADV